MHDKPDRALLELIAAWVTEAEDGEAITIKIVSMTDREVSALPDV